MTTAAFFDIGDTLGAVRVRPSGEGIDEIAGLPRRARRARGAARGRRGVGDHRRPGRDPGRGRGGRAGRRAGVLEFFDPALIVYGRKDSSLIFESAAARVPDGPRRLLFVGEDAQERAFAQAAGFAVGPHPRLAPRMLLGPGLPLRFLRIRVPDVPDWRARLRALPVVPLHVAAGTAVPEVYAVADSATALQLDDAGFWVDRLGADDAPATSELFLLRADGLTDDAGAAVAFAADGDTARGVLASTAEGLLVAIPAGRSIDFLHLGAARHGHNLKLTAMPALLAEPAAGPPLDVAAAEPPPPPDPDVVELVRAEVTEAGLAETVRPLQRHPAAGGRDDLAPAPAHPAPRQRPRGGRAGRRPHRARRAGRAHPPLRHAGRPLDNVEATLAGSGLPGAVLVTAHLDSTAARDPGYQPATDPAPGADDDGSGIASVLAAARAVLALVDAHAVPRREVRFVLFNAEEQGLVGSRAYARDQAALGADIVAVLQLDMIGYDVAAGRAFELHAGFSPSAAVEQQSVELAGQVAAVVAAVSPDLPAAAGLPRGRRAGPGRGPQRPPQLPGQRAPRVPGLRGLLRRPRSGLPDAGSQPELPLGGRRDGRRQLRPRQLPGRHRRRLAQRHPLRTRSAATSSRSRNAASSAVKACGLSWLLACPASGIVT